MIFTFDGFFEFLFTAGDRLADKPFSVLLDTPFFICSHIESTRAFISTMIKKNSIIPLNQHVNMKSKRSVERKELKQEAIKDI